MKPSQALDLNRAEVKAVIARYSVRNPRLFGSAATGQDHEGSDLDLLVDALPGTTLMDLCGLQYELESLLGLPVDVRTPQDLNRRYRDKVLAAAQSL